MIQKKICLIGDYAVGKTSLIRQFVYSKFEEDYLTTIGVHITKKKVELENETINLIIWDLAGNDGLHKITPSYLQGASGAIIVGDLTREETIANIKDHYQQLQSLQQVPAIVAINKIDLIDDLDGDFNLPNLSSDIELPDNISILQTSAKTGEKVNDLFLILSKSIYEMHRK